VPHEWDFSKESLGDEDIAPELKELLEKARKSGVEDPLKIEQIFANVLRESDRAAALIAVAFLDLLLALLIARRLIDPETADNLLGFDTGNRP
jgi:hypothetical protein